MYPTMYPDGSRAVLIGCFMLARFVGGVLGLVTAHDEAVEARHGVFLRFGWDM
ncbi:hypothetical protein [Frankia sp. CiP3]|uniref:hypothetical protein n=1 Tax=Frankia sp. CiP3 TaxID=2880971 RepID=UPI001EF6DC21|nr:hypothetical protein [Frankia sp. CiP3]